MSTPDPFPGRPGRPHSRAISADDIRPHPTDSARWRVASAAEPGAWHDVDIVNETCDCLGFQHVTSKRPRGTLMRPNPARWCRHLARVMTIPLWELAAITASPHGDTRCVGVHQRHVERCHAATAERRADEGR